MSKAQLKSSFFHYMLYFRRQQEMKGVRFANGMADVSTAASESWMSMTDDEKRPYQELAKAAKGSNGSSVASVPLKAVSGNTVTDLYMSEPVSVVIKRKVDAAKEEQDMKSHIAQIVQTSMLKNAFQSQNYYLVAFNYFCKSHQNEYFPAELAMCRFNLKNGQQAVYHSHINPGKLPTGYAFEAKYRSDTTHRLPPPPFAIGLTDYAQLLMEIAQFLTDEHSLKFPPLFTFPDQVQPLRTFLRKICEDNYENPDTFLVYPLTQLFFVLKREAASHNDDNDPEMMAFPSVHIAQLQFEHDPFEYRNDLACQFHVSEDAAKFCALSMVHRWALLMLANLKNVLPDDECSTTSVLDSDDSKSVASSSHHSRITDPIVCHVNASRYGASDSNFDSDSSYVGSVFESSGAYDATTEVMPPLIEIRAPTMRKRMPRLPSKYYDSDASCVESDASTAVTVPRVMPPLSEMKAPPSMRTPRLPSLSSQIFHMFEE